MMKKLIALMLFFAACALLGACAGNDVSTGDRQEGSTSGGGVQQTEVADADSPIVYFTSDISAEGLVRIYDALEWTPEGRTAGLSFLPQ